MKLQLRAQWRCVRSQLSRLRPPRLRQHDGVCMAGLALPRRSPALRLPISAPYPALVFVRVQYGTLALSRPGRPPVGRGIDERDLCGRPEVFNNDNGVGFGRRLFCCRMRCGVAAAG
jgi:hypothetical protein